MKATRIFASLLVAVFAAVALATGPPDSLKAYLAKTPVVLPFQGAPAPATTIEGLVSYRLKLSAVATQRIGALHNLFGRKGFDVDVRPFLGINLSENNAGAGGIAFAIPRPIRIASEVSVSGGVFLQGTINHPVDGGVYVSFTWRLGS